MAHKQQLLDALKDKLKKFHAATPPANMEEIRELFSDFAGKPLSADTLMTLLAAGHDMEAVARAAGDGKGVSFDQLSKIFVIGVQPTDTAEALGAVLDKHIAKLETSSGSKTATDDTAAQEAAASEAGAQV